MIQDLEMFLLYTVGTVIMLFLFTYLILRRGKGVFYEIARSQRHPYHFTLVMAVGAVAGISITHLSRYYFKPSPVDTLYYLVFFQFLLITFIAIVFGVRLWNLEKKQLKELPRQKRCKR